MSDDNNRDGRLASLTQDALSGRISRRRFMEGSIAAGLTATAATSLWSTGVQASTPQRGGTYRVGWHDGNTTDKLDPATTEGVFMIQMNHTMRNYLTEITPTNQVGPDISESWNASDDASVWTFQLRKGVEFHNGKPFTARDAMDSLNYHRNPDNASAAKPLLDDVKDIRMDGDHTLVVEMSSGNADLPYVLSDYHLVMMPSDGEGKVDKDSGIGTGPYKVDHFEPGVRAEMTRNDNYFKSDRAWFDAVDALTLNDGNARQSALMTDEVDAISEVDLKTVGLMARRDDIVIDEVASGAHCTIPMFCDVAPFDNLDVRLALKYGIDREAIISKILRGHGTIGNDHPIGPSLPYWADLEQRQYDPDKSKFHLKKAGMENLKVELSAADSVFPGAVDMVVLYADSAKAGGIDIAPRREPNDGYWSNVWLVKPFVVVSWGARPTPDVMFTLAYKSDAPWNESHWQNARFNELLLQAKGELNEDRRADMYREMQQLCRDDGGTVVPFFRNRVMARQERVQHGPNISGNWELDGGRSAERWWFAS
ncbi:MAG: ABC transporter substrate-binding protein [Rhodospirillales bacterium]